MHIHRSNRSTIGHTCAILPEGWGVHSFRTYQNITIICQTRFICIEIFHSYFVTNYSYILLQITWSSQQFPLWLLIWIAPNFNLLALHCPTAWLTSYSTSLPPIGGTSFECLNHAWHASTQPQLLRRGSARLLRVKARWLCGGRVVSSQRWWWWSAAVPRGVGEVVLAEQVNDNGVEAAACWQDRLWW